MKESYILKYHELEADNWWFLGRRDILCRLMQTYSRDSEVLDIGCSGGLLMEALKKHGYHKVSGIDINERAISLCRQRGLDNVRVADAVDSGFADRSFDVVIASDVLEHVVDEHRALMEWNRLLRQDGRLIVFVPAFSFLWSGHDDANQHFRRYSKRPLMDIISANGFIVERSFFWNFSLFFPAGLLRLFQRYVYGGNSKSAGQLERANPFINNILRNILFAENKVLSAGMNFPVGLSISVIARKP